MRIVEEGREMNFKLLVAIVSVTGTVIQVIRTILRGWPDLFVSSADAMAQDSYDERRVQRTQLSTSGKKASRL